MTYERITDPAVEPITLNEAKSHLRIPVSDTNDDTYITSLITAARRLFEYHTGIVTVTCNWKLYLDDVPEYDIFKRAHVVIGRCPVTVIAVKYYDEDNTLQTFNSSNYHADIVSQPSRIYFENEPDLYDKPNALVIEFTAGYADAAHCPKEIKQAILLLIAHLYENRQPVLANVQSYEVPETYKSIIVSLRV